MAINYRWQCAHEWLDERIAYEKNVDVLRRLIRDLASTIDHATLEDLLEHELKAGGFYTPVSPGSNPFVGASDEVAMEKRQPQHRAGPQKGWMTTVHIALTSEVGDEDDALDWVNSFFEENWIGGLLQWGYAKIGAQYLYPTRQAISLDSNGNLEY